MANYTQKAILQTLEDMLLEMPFDKITVSALVARCGVSSNTFYYHFHDIYDLLDIYIKKREKDFLKEVENIDDWSERLKVALHRMQDHPKRVYHISDSISREQLERYVFTEIENQFYEHVKERAAGASVSDETLKKIAGFYCYSLLGFFLKFLWGHMSIDIDASVDSLNQIFSDILEYVIQKAGITNSGPASDSKR
jgi:AcrR family transcriptional regulator